MAFNFEIKKRTYVAVRDKCVEQLKADDRDNALINLDQAVALSNELIAHCQIPELTTKFKSEQATLLKIKAKLAEGINPYTQKKPEPMPQGPGKPAAAPGQEEAPKAKYLSTDAPKHTMEDVAGLEDVKQQIRLNVLLRLQNPDLYFHYHDTSGCRILMYGPPGTGKTFVAECIAGELKCPYANIKIQDILDKYVGEAPRKIKEIFEEANTYDNCLLFFDEIDGMCSSRDSDDSAHTKDILTTFLTCMSGFGTDSKEKVRVIIAATNRPWALDSALIRGHRFDTQLYVSLPDYDARLFLVKKNFKKHMDIIEGSDITMEEIATELDGWSGADIDSIITKMKDYAMNRTIANPEAPYEKVTRADFDKAKASSRNSVIPESLVAFEAFRKGEL